MANKKTTKKESNGRDFDPIDPSKIKKKKPSKFSGPRDRTEWILLIVFIALLILTIFLMIKAISTGREVKKENTAEIIMPVIEANSNNELSVDISNMKKQEEKEYVFKVSNYKGSEINKEELTYTLEITKDSDVSLEIYKNDEDKNVLDYKELKVTDNKLLKDEEQVDTYKLKIKTTKKTGKDEFIRIKIVS